ncbi:MAG: hypothetical protein PUE12_07915 [Oscillospiraceae bacterium]|nr:hypothetical protein [Oscillospiraceae bacterium]
MKLNEPITIDHVKIFINVLRKNKKTIRTTLYIIMYIIILTAILPIYLKEGGWGLDPSWRYLINIAHEKNIIFGKDVFFTYGPLGFITANWGVSSNQHIYYLFLSSFFLYDSFALYYLLLKDSNKSFYFILFATIISYNTFLSPIETPILFLIFSMYLMTFMAIKKKYSTIHFLILCICAALMWMIKFDIAVLSTAISAMFVICIIIHNLANYYTSYLKNTATDSIFSENKIKVLPYIIIFLCIPIFFCTFYLVYNPSLLDMKNYLLTGFQISSGYSSAMSFTDNSIISQVIYGTIIYLVILIVLIIYKSDAIYNALLLSVLLAFSFKYAAVRSEYQHTCFIIMAYKTILFLLMLSITFKPNTKPIKQVVSIVLLFSTFLGFNYIYNYHFTLKTRIHNHISYTLSSNYSLPKTIKQKIGNNTVTTYPWNILWIESEDLNYTCMPIPQAYCAYTPFLDDLNANFFSSEQRPKYIILEPETIDDRILQWESPATWNAIENNYNITEREDNIILLEESISDSKENLVYYRIPINQDCIIVPLSSNKLMMKFNMELTASGKIKKMISSINPIYADLTYSDGSNKHIRIIPEQLSQGVMLNDTIFDETNRQITKIEFLGDDLKYYNTSGYIELAEY